MSITLRDVGALINLPPLGDTIFPGILISSVAQKFDKKLTESYSSLQGYYNHSNAEPSHAERVAFIQIRLCKYILCVPSIKPSMSYLPIVHKLACGRPLNLCSFFFAALYRGMASLQFQLKNGASPTGSELLWFTQLWLRAYFPSLGALSRSLRSVSCYGLAIDPLSHVNMSRRDIFSFFYILNLIPSFFPFPTHLTSDYVQPPSTLDNASTSLLVWVQFLTGRELFHDILIGTNAKAGVEIYAPQFFARQFGFGQTWPVPPCYSKILIGRFHTINKAEAQAIDARSILLMSNFSLAPSILTVPFTSFLNNSGHQ
ncbi:Hypothetical predicted protein [Olea europaea subsp. europaea]|uniref:Aminotransferase-like plant mobile domain-containing protein n=1 Tax=Olea europaea subsp. europaea TaxID=158383 RepID=A0A8S0PPB2_OLEEU|nr:Hypothetical predicted protein [Olea europaea subsp. europaea]